MPERWHCYILWAQIPVFTSAGKGLVFSADGVWLKVNLVPSVSIAKDAFSLSKDWGLMVPSLVSCDRWVFPARHRSDIIESSGRNCDNWKNPTPIPQIKGKTKLSSQVKFAAPSLQHQMPSPAVNHPGFQPLLSHKIW